MLMMQQVKVILWQSLSQLRSRLFETCSGIIGIAGIMLVYVAVLALLSNLQQMQQSDGVPADTVVILKQGADSDISSWLPGNALDQISSHPAIRQHNGQALISGELFAPMNLLRADTNTDASVSLRGVGTASATIHALEIVQGRMLQPGEQEIIVGEALLSQFAQLQLGSTIQLGNQHWRIVGVFKAPQQALNSEIWADVQLVQMLYRRGHSFSRLVAWLEPGQLAAFADELQQNSTLGVQVMSLPQFYQQQIQGMADLVRVLGLGMAALISLGALCGTLNTVYASVAKRKRELAVLRAVGFQPFAIGVALYLEILLFALMAAGMGGALAWLIFADMQFATLNQASFSQMVLQYQLTPQVFGSALLICLGICSVACAAPLRAVMQQSVSQALKGLK